MTKLELKYNSFTKKIEFFRDGEKTKLTECFGTGEDIQLHKHIGDFFPSAMKKFKLTLRDECTIQFYGTKDAFDDVKDAFKDYCKQFEDIKPEEIKTELLEYVPYPHNFTEIKLLIEEKKGKYLELISSKNEALQNHLVNTSNIDISDVEEQFAKDIKAIKDIYNHNNEKNNSVIAKAKEGFNLSSSVENEIKALDKPAKKGNTNTQMKSDTTEKTFNGDEANKCYKENIDIIKLCFTKDRKNMFVLLSSLFGKLSDAINSIFKEIYNVYSANYSELISSFNTFYDYSNILLPDTDETIPDSCFKNMEIKAKSNVIIGYAKIKEDIDKTISDCQSFYDSLFDKYKQNFLTETEKCRDYYLNKLTELQEIIRNKLTGKAKISVIQNKIECLEELLSDIDKLENK
jgi:hypothetical protein